MEKYESNVWTWIFLLIVSASRIAMGLFWSLSGPTLLYLSENTHSSVGQVSSIFTARAGGFLLGSMLCSVLIRTYKGYKPLLTVGISIIISGALMLSTPWLTDLASLVVVTMITAIMFGYLDSGMQSIFLKLWGERGSRPYLQSFHFSFGIGAMLAPLIAQPFLELADEENEADTSCPSSSTSASLATTFAPSLNTTDILTTAQNEVSTLNPVAWPYIIAGSFTTLCGLMLFISALCLIEAKIKKNNETKLDHEENDKEEPLKNVIFLFIPVLVYYFGIVGIETTFQSYIYSVALCSGASFSVKDASFLNTMFWIGFTIGRGSGVITAYYFLPATLIIFDLIGTNMSMIFLSIFGETVPLVLWIGSCLIGLTVATFYSSGISWTAQKTNVSSSYIFLFALGNTAGQMTMPLLGGYLFDMDPFNVMYLLLGLAVLNIISSGWSYLAGRKFDVTQHSKTDADVSTKL